jgi:hypothetical protein
VSGVPVELLVVVVVVVVVGVSWQAMSRVELKKRNAVPTRARLVAYVITTASGRS